MNFNHYKLIGVIGSIFLLIYIILSFFESFLSTMLYFVQNWYFVLELGFFITGIVLLLFFIHFIAVQQNYFSIFKNYLFFSIMWIIGLCIPLLLGPITDFFSVLSKDGFIIQSRYISFSAFVLIILYITKYSMLNLAAWKLDESYASIHPFSKNKLLKISGKTFCYGTNLILIFGLIEIAAFALAKTILNLKFIAYAILIASIIIQIITFVLIPNSFFIRKNNGMAKN